MDKHYKLFSISGLLILMLGGIFYLIFRPESYITNAILNSDTVMFPGFWLPGSGSIPSFLHTIAFSMLTIAFLELNKANIIATALFWFCINIVYELFSSTDYAKNLGLLFVNDINDIFLSLFGASVFVLITLIHMRHINHLS